VVVKALEHRGAAGRHFVEFRQRRVPALGQSLGAEPARVDPYALFAAVGRERFVGVSDAFEDLADGGAIGELDRRERLAVGEEVEVGIAQVGEVAGCGAVHAGRVPPGERFASENRGADPAILLRVELMASTGEHRFGPGRWKMEATVRPPSHKDQSP